MIPNRQSGESMASSRLRVMTNDGAYERTAGTNGSRVEPWLSTRALACWVGYRQRLPTSSRDPSPALPRRHTT